MAQSNERMQLERILEQGAPDALKKVQGTARAQLLKTVESITVSKSYSARPHLQTILKPTNESFQEVQRKFSRWPKRKASIGSKSKSLS
jgi:hypothetical protein